MQLTVRSLRFGVCCRFVFSKVKCYNLDRNEIRDGGIENAVQTARDKVRKDAISTLVSAAKKVAIDEGCRDDIREELVDRVILKEIKSVKEQIDTCPASREDLLAEYKTRYDIFMEYAPKMMSADEVEAFITEKFADVVASHNKGQIMKAVMPELKGKAEGSVINQVVAKLCQA